MYILLYIFFLYFYILFILYIIYIIYIICNIYIYCILYFLYSKLYYIYIMFGGVSWVGTPGNHCWMVYGSCKSGKKGFGGTPISGNLHLTGLMLVCREDMLFFPPSNLPEMMIFHMTGILFSFGLIVPRGLNTTHSTGNIGQFFEHSCWIVAYGMPSLQYYSKNMFYDLKCLMCKPEFSHTGPLYGFLQADMELG